MCGEATAVLLLVGVWYYIMYSSYQAKKAS
jgi:hypothetical protein